MARTAPNDRAPANEVITTIISAPEKAALDEYVRRMRMETGEAVTRSSLLRQLLVERLFPTVNP